jgi:hypothetical protein
MDELRAELLGDTPSAVEKLLVDRVVVCWAQTALADLDGVQQAKAGAAQGSHAERRQTGAQTRYLAALKQLEVVRKLARPAPSALDLLRVPVGETTPVPPAGRRISDLKLCPSGNDN